MQGGVSRVLEPLSVAIGLSGVGDLVAIWRGIRPLRYLFKPGTMALIIALGAAGLPEAGPYGFLILAGLLCSLAGDIFLVLPRSRFLAGLTAFFCAHLLYIAAFLWRASQDLAALPGAPWATALLVAVLLAAGVHLFRRVRPGVLREGGARLLVPVGLYICVISLMALSAAVTGSAAVLAGALLFCISDTILAWNRFVRPLPRADLGVMSTYFAAQYLIAASVLAVN